MERLNIIIPIYNSDYIEKQLFSIRNLAQFNIDILVIYIDDGSDWEHRNMYSNILDDFIDLHITYHSLGDKNGENRVCKARNKGAELATGDNLLFIDQETILSGVNVENLIEKYGKSDTVVLGPYYGYNNIEKGISDGDISFFIGNGYVDNDNYRDFRVNFYKEKEENKRIWEFFGASNFFIKKSTFTEIGGFDESITTWGDEDIEFGYRLFKSGCQIIFDVNMGVLNLSEKLYNIPYSILEDSKVESLSENWYKNYQKHRSYDYKRYIFDRYSHLDDAKNKLVSENFKKNFLNKKNILIHAINGIGLGHIKRTLIVAKELCNLDEIGEIIFVSNSQNTFLIKNEGFRVEKLDYGIGDTIKNISFDAYENANFSKINQILSENRIDIMIHDTFFIKTVLQYRKDLKHFLILRDSEPEYLNTIKDYLQKFKRVFVPHIYEELSQEKKLFFDGHKNIQFVNYITESKSNQLLVPRDKKIIVSPGYGGDFENSKTFFTYINDLLVSNIKLLESYQVDIFLGKHYEQLLQEVIFHSDFNIGKFQENLFDELGKCRLFIGRGGYNTLNEVTINKTGSLLFGVDRVFENQGARIDFFIQSLNASFIKKGIYDIDADSASLVALLSGISGDDMDYSDLFHGAEVISNEMTREIHKENILVFKHIFLPLSENFIFEELSGFTRINPIIFTLKNENIDAFNNSFECYYNSSFDELLGLDYPHIHNHEKYIKFLKYVASIIKKNNIKVIYTEFLFDAFFISRIKSLCKGIKIFSAGRGYDVYDFLEKPDFNSELLFTSLDGIFTRDRAMQQAIANKGYKKVDIIRSVLDFNKYEFTKKNFDTFDILIGGRFVEKKNFLELIDLLKLLSENGLVRKIGIVGDGKLLVKIISKINELGLGEMVKKYGFLSHKDLLIVLKEYNCFINYSKKSPSGDDEGIPNLILENILSGNLIFSSITGGIGELLVSDSANSLSGDLNTDLNRIRSLFESKDLIQETIKKDYNTVTSMYAKENALLKLENKLLGYDK